MWGLSNKFSWTQIDVKLRLNQPDINPIGSLQSGLRELVDVAQMGCERKLLERKSLERKLLEVAREQANLVAKFQPNFYRNAWIDPKGTPVTQ